MAGKQELWLRILPVAILLGSCETTRQPPPEEAQDQVYLQGRGIAKYHNYDGVSKCRTAFGLDPAAFQMRVTAASSEIARKFPAMGKVGPRNGPYDGTARCLRVEREDTRKSIVVRAIDICCGGDLSNSRTHQLDLSRQAFEELGPRSLGNLRVNWAVIDCPPSLRLKSEAAVCNEDYYFTGD